MTTAWTTPAAFARSIVAATSSSRSRWQWESTTLMRIPRGAPWPLLALPRIGANGAQTRSALELPDPRVGRFLRPHPGEDRPTPSNLEGAAASQGGLAYPGDGPTPAPRHRGRSPRLLHRPGLIRASPGPRGP